MESKTGGKRFQSKIKPRASSHVAHSTAA